MSLRTLIRTPVKKYEVLILKQLPEKLARRFCIARKVKWRKCMHASIHRKYSQKDEPNIINSPLGTVTVPNVPFHELIFQNWSNWERKIALECGATGRKYTFRKIMQNSKTLAAALQNKFKMKKGDLIALILPNCPEYPIVVLGCTQCGVVPTTVNPVYTIDEIQMQISECKVKIIFTDHKNYEKCAAVVTAMKAAIPIVVLRTTSNAEVPDGGVDLQELFDSSTSGDFRPTAFTHEDQLLLPFSSGTTGGTKGVILTHGNLVSNLTQINHPETVIMNPTTKFHQDTIFGILPMFHIYGLVIVTFYSLKYGCKLITLPRFNPYLYVSNIVKKRANILYVVPPIIFFLTRKEIKPKFLKSLKFIVNAASPIVVKDAYAVLEKAGHVHIVQGYGMTEASPALAHTSMKRPEKLTSIGIPVASTKLKIASLETGEALPKNEHGELCAFGPQIMKGYFNRPEETKNAFDKDGWLKTGDLAYYDDDGDFFIVERLKDLIKVKGFQVAPFEIEEVLLSHPKIAEAAVIGVPDDEFGEVPKAFIILKKGAELTEEEVKEFIKKKLSSYKHLRGGVKFVKEFPRNNIGKVLRKDLKTLG